jgi:hypothetical protein
MTIIVALRRLDLDDVRPEIGEQRRAIGTGEDAGKIEDFQTL